MSLTILAERAKAEILARVERGWGLYPDEARALIARVAQLEAAMNEPIAVVVPKELYYHEVGYVRGLEARMAKLEAALRRLVADYQDVPDPTDADGQQVFAEARAALEDALQ